MVIQTLEGSIDEMIKIMEKNNWFEIFGTTKEKWAEMMLKRLRKKWWQFWIPNF